ncbi:hypothetical protein N7G274_008095 [Stereocaulon virgatum]|uniref:NACHT domain-containing protein n=1 Tax=Stereocaulon virgatum TaxID=373712 RepID=A0ABR4A263_9LECA
MTATLPNEDAWTRAKDRYLEDLTDTERALFNKASIETILYDASAAEKRHCASTKSRALSKKLEPLVSAIDQYGEAMHVYVNAFSPVLSPLWGSIRVVLYLASEFQKYFNKLVDMFANIGDVLPRFRIYEKLFSNHEVLIQSLSQVYVDIIEFCTAAKKIFRDGKRAPGLRAALTLTWKPFEQQFGTQLDHFRQHRKNVEKEAGLAHMIEAADSRALTLANQMQMEKDRELGERRQLLKILSTVNYVAKHEKIQEARYEGTGDWFLDNAPYLLWKEADASACLCCTGIPGSGKTFLASRVIDDLLQESNHTDLHTIYYYCDYGDVKTVQAQHVLEAILKQLLLKSGVPETVKCQLKNTYLDEMRSSGVRHLGEYISSAIVASSGVCIIVDGLDECETEARQDVMTLLKSLFNLGQPTVKVLVFCREDDQILTCSDNFPRIQVSESMLATDIETFITGSVKSRIRSRRLKLDDPTLEYNIVSDLIAKAQGMFLWFHFQLEELCEATSDTHIRQILRDLPKGLAETYGRILEKLGNSGKKCPPRVFRWIACAQRPLRLGELQEVVGHELTDRSWRDATGTDGDRLIRSCGALVCIDEDDQTVRFAHHTVLQFLLSPGEVPSYHFNLAEANRHVGEMCVNYLCFSDFETAVKRRLPDQSIRDAPVFRPGGVAGISSLLGMSRLTSNIARLFHGGKSDNQMDCVDIDYERYMRSPQKPTEPLVPALAKKYLLLEYVVANWDWHTKWLEESNSAI